MQISWPNPGSPPIILPDSGRSVPKTVHSSSANCTVRNLHTSGIDAGHVRAIKNVWLQNKLRRVNFYIGYFLRFHTIVSEYFRNTTCPTTCHLQVRRLKRLEGSKTFFAEHVAIMTSLIKRFKAPQIISTAELGKCVITGVNSTSGDIHHCKIPLLICNWIFT